MQGTCKSVLCLFIFVGFTALATAQTAPNLENGFKAYGSYDGSRLDTVNLMNGNLMVHAPLTPDTPQRGSLKVSNALYVSSKDWQAVCTAPPNSGQVCNWRKGGSGVTVLPTPGLSVHRTLNNSFFGGQGNPTSEAAGYTIVTPDQASHPVHGVAGTQDANGEPTQFDSADLSGFHLVLSNPDPTTQVYGQATVIDRSGNQYQGTFAAANCGRAPTNYMIGVPGPVQPMVDDAPAGEQYCPQTAFATLVTDSNGNQISLHGPTNLNPTLDTLGKTPALTTGDSTDFSGCVTSHTIYSAFNYHYQDPNGVARNIKFCSAEVPIQTAFGQPTIGEASTSPDPNSGLHFRPVVTAILPDGTRWTFDYDSYGEITSIGLPTGGSIAYTWTTVNHAACSNGSPGIFSRAVATRTLNDGQGHSYQWRYNWGVPTTNSVTNTVTDPLTNDTVHVFTDPGPLVGIPSMCRFYETSTIQYTGAAGANQLIQRVDTTYSATNMSLDDTGLGSPGLANVFATDIVTTVYPSGKVKKVHKDPDPGLGAGLPGFGGVVKELDYDWGPSGPGPLLRETDTVYQWQKNSAYRTANLLDLPASVVVISPVAAANIKSGCPINPSGGTASCMAETDYAYDEPGYLTTPSPQVTTQHTSAPPYGVRGNQTTVSRWLNPGSWVSSHTNWYDTGEPYLHIDPLGHTTTVSYHTDYVGAYVTQTCSPATSGVAHCVSGTYDLTTGVLTSLTNENATTQASGNTPGDAGHTSNYSYDSVFHPTSGQAPPDPAYGNARATTSLSYSTTALPTTFPITITRLKSVTTALSDSATSTYDGLGRVYKAQHAMPTGNPATVDTTFDLGGRVGSVSNSYFTTADPTYGSTSTQYDALDRPLQITEQDGSVKSISYDVVTPPGTNGNCNDTSDEIGNKRRTCSDALGRLVEVDEPNPGAAATSASANITINGSEQTNPLPATGGTGSVIVSGSEGTSQVCTDPIPPAHPVCHTIPDAGSIGIRFGTYPILYVTYGSSSTGATLALAIQQGYQNDPSSPVNATIDPSNNTKINFAARGTGAATNYAITYSNGADFSVGGLSALSGGRDASSSPDTGTVSVTVNGTVYSTTYSGSDTGGTIVGRLASSISAGAFANASAQGNVITLTAKSTGTGGDYQIAASSTYDSAHFSGPSFAPSPTTGSMSNGYSVGDIGNQSFVTLYQYDALGNLLCVEQHGNTTGTGCSASPASDATSPWRVRRFTYDSLRRLLTAKNPESGTIAYTYDNDGNLLQKTSPAPNQTGTATQTVSFCYDELHRVTGRGYGAQSCPQASPVVSYTYDSGANAKGHLTSMTDQAGTATYAHDILGRLVTETRTLVGANGATIQKTVSYEYNLDGSLKTLHYPSGAAVTYTPDAAGRMVSAVDGGSNINYVTGATYGPDSALTGFISGSGGAAAITNSFTYNKRLQPVAMSATTSSQTVYSIGYDFHAGNGTPGSGVDNGNVFGITNYKDSTRSQTFTYDPLNRLISARNAGTDCTVHVLGGNLKFWGNNYAYDAWGNLTGKSLIPASQSGPAACAGELLSVTAGADNKLGGSYVYDAAGNMTHDATSGLNYSWDQENRLTGASGYTYTYDGDGNRVRKSNGNTASSGTLYWYMTPGVVAETDLAGTTKSEYIFFDGERVARRDGATGTGGVFYYFSDHLKTASVITDSFGVIKAESDYYPWGGELQFVNNDSNDYKFTGKKRDTETGLDYFGARYYSNGLGRWVSADWSATPVPVPYADFGEPQSLNLYQFVGGNPASKADADGHCLPCVERAAEEFAESPAGAEMLSAVGKVTGAIGGGLAIGWATTSDAAKKAWGEFTDALGAGQPCCLADLPQPPPAGAVDNLLSLQKASPPNPDGSKGAPDHQQTADEEAAKIKGDREVRVQTPGGEKDSRVIDAAKVKNGKVTKATQVIRPNKNGTPPAREVRAANDIEKATGVKPKLVPVRPFKKSKKSR